MKGAYILILTFTLGSYSFSQMTKEELVNFIAKASEKELVAENASEMTNGEFYHADMIADKLLEINPNSNNYLYRKGYIASKLNKKPDVVLSYLGKINGKLTRSFDAYSTKDYASVDVYYYMGLAYQKLEQFDSSEYYFQQYLDNSLKTSYLYKDAQNRIAQSKNGKPKIEGKDKDIQIVNLGENINSEFPDYASFVTSDDGKIYYTTRRSWDNSYPSQYVETMNGLFPEDIFMAEADGNSWGKSSKLNLNTRKYNEAMVSINRSAEGDGNVFIYTDSLGRGDIMITQIIEGGQLQTPQVLEIKDINAKKYWEPSFISTNNGNRIYFSSDRKGGYGGLDLYYMDRNSDGSWSDPVNLGPGINTPANEDAPSFTYDGKYFIYASNGAKSMGGYDLFYSTVLGNNSLSEGKALPYPLNTSADEIYYNSSADGLKGYITSDRIDSYGEKDIYEVKHNYLGIEKVRFVIITLLPENGNEITNEKVRITCMDCTDNTAEILEARQRDSKVIKALEPCHKYQVEYLIGDEVESTDTIVSDCELAYQHIAYDHQYGPIVKEVEDVIEPIVIAQYQKSFGYNFNKVSVTDKDYVEAVTKARTALKSDEKMKLDLEIYSSASTVPTRKYKTNENLAQLRANNMMKMLLNEFNDEELSRINIVVKESKVSGPEYNDDASSRDKYAPYQYVKVQVIQK